MDRALAACEADPSVAKQTAEELANAPDGMILNWADAPSPANVEAWNAWIGQSDAFEKVAAPINAQRLALFNSLKEQGKSDLDIVKAIMNFNGNQPVEYQIKTGFIKIDITA